MSAVRSARPVCHVLHRSAEIAWRRLRVSPDLDPCRYRCTWIVV